MDAQQKARHTALVLALGSVQGAADRLPSEDECRAAGIDSGQLFEAELSIGALYDGIRSLLITSLPCPTCNGQGGWEDCGPNEGCAEFAPCQDIECRTCSGRGWMYGDE